MDGIYATVPPLTLPCGNGFSFYFDLINRLWKTPEGEACVTATPFHRICSLMRKMQANYLIEENVGIEGEILDEIDDLKTCTGAAVSAEAYRITFFRSDTARSKFSEFDDSELLGYMVLVNVDYGGARKDGGDCSPSSYIVEAVVRPPTIFEDSGKIRAVKNYYVHCWRNYTLRIGTADLNKEFSFPGTFYCQQNRITHVCGHAAVRIAINTFSEYRGPKLTNRMLNKLWDIDLIDRNPSGGITDHEILRAIVYCGFDVVSFNFEKDNEPGFDEIIYPLMESGFPVILCIANLNLSHVLTIVGHTLNSDRWAPVSSVYERLGMFPTRAYIPATAWTDHLIHNDDNSGMYLTLPVDQLKSFIFPRYNPALHPINMAAIVPKGMTTNPYRAELASMEFVQAYTAELNARPENFPENRWRNTLQTYAGRENVVRRTICAPRDRYIEDILSSEDEKGRRVSQEFVETLKELPELIWITEVSLPDLFCGNRRKLGDSIVGPSGTIDVKPLIVWIVDWAIVMTSEPRNVATGFTGHIPLMRSPNSYEHRLEW